MLKISYEAPDFELVRFESVDEITNLSSSVDESGNGNGDNEIGADSWL